MPSRKERKRRRRKGESVSDDSSPDTEESDSSESDKELPDAVEKYRDNYVYLVAIPLLILFTALVIIGYTIQTTGTFVSQDVSLKGGLTLTYLARDAPAADAVEATLTNDFPSADVRARNIEQFGERRGVTIDATDIERDAMVNTLQNEFGGFQDYSVERIGSSLGQSFFRQTMLALLVAFIFMSLVVFYYFRTFVPSAAVILAAFSDIVVTVAVMNVLDIRLSTAGIAALLMLIGYSVDTDILLSTRVLKRHEGTAFERMFGAVKTGLTLNMTTLIAISIALLVSQSQTISQIMTILLIGLLVDVVNTWLQNTGILTWYVQREELV